MVHMAGPAQTANPQLAAERFHETALLGMLASGYGAVLGSGFLDWPTAVLAFAALLVRGLMAARVVAFDVPGKLVAGLTLAYIGFYPLDYLYVSRSFLQATVHMVFFVAVMKLLTASTERDFGFLKVIAGLELLAAALLSSSLSFFGFLALFLLCTVATLASGEVRRSARQAGSVQPRRATVARGGPRDLSRRLGVLSTVLFTGILALTAGMFFVLPRTARAALQHLIPERYHLPGFSNEVNLGDIGEIKRNTSPVFHARSYQGETLSRLRWRGAALAQFDGRRWFNTPGFGARGGEDRLKLERGVVSLPATRHTRPGHYLMYQVELNEIASDTLFFAGTPESIRVGTAAVRRGRGGSLHFSRFGPGGFGYGVTAFLEDENETPDSAPEPLSPASAQEMLELPEIDGRIPELARQMSAGAATDLNRARAIERRLRSDYGYTLELPAAAVSDPLAYFLFARRKGHCEYFASAMAVMLRSQGIPSRVATGFLSGVYNPMTGWQVIRASDAHSWVEGWIAGYGWTTFDPTPSDPAGASLGFLSRMSLYMDAAEQFWHDWVLGYDLERQVVLASRMEESSRRLRLDWLERSYAWVQKTAQSAQTYALAIAAALFAGFLLVWRGPAVCAWWKSQARIRKAQRGEGQASDATLLYERMLGLLARRGIHKPPWLTPAEFARVLPPSEAALVVHDLTLAYNQFRFGGRPAAAPRMVRLLDQLEKL